MFDEPSLGLAPAIVHNVLDTIRDLNRDGMTCLLVEQNVALSLKLASRAYVLENGRVTLTGSGAELLADDRVRTRLSRIVDTLVRAGAGCGPSERTRAPTRALSGARGKA